MMSLKNKKEVTDFLDKKFRQTMFNSQVHRPEKQRGSIVGWVQESDEEESEDDIFRVQTSHSIALRPRPKDQIIQSENTSLVASQVEPIDRKEQQKETQKVPEMIDSSVQLKGVKSENINKSPENPVLPIKPKVRLPVPVKRAPPRLVENRVNTEVKDTSVSEVISPKVEAKKVSIAKSFVVTRTVSPKIVLTSQSDEESNRHDTNSSSPKFQPYIQEKRQELPHIERPAYRVKRANRVQNTPFSPSDGQIRFKSPFSPTSENSIVNIAKSFLANHNILKQKSQSPPRLEEENIKKPNPNVVGQLVKGLCFETDPMKKYHNPSVLQTLPSKIPEKKSELTHITIGDLPLPTSPSILEKRNELPFLERPVLRVDRSNRVETISFSPCDLSTQVRPSRQPPKGLQRSIIDLNINAESDLSPTAAQAKLKKLLKNIPDSVLSSYKKSKAKKEQGVSADISSQLRPIENSKTLSTSIPSIPLALKPQNVKFAKPLATKKASDLQKKLAHALVTFCNYTPDNNGSQGIFTKNALLKDPGLETDSKLDMAVRILLDCNVPETKGTLEDLTDKPEPTHLESKKPFAIKGDSIPKLRK